MSTYRTRPIFDFSIEWGESPSMSIKYDLEEIEIGFGQVEFAPLQVDTVHGFNLVIWMDSTSEIIAVDDFFDSVMGRLRGFWLPSPHTAFKISGGFSATQFDITDQGLTDTWSNHPSTSYVHLVYGSAVQYAKITAVSDNGDGTERVTVEETLSPAIDENWKAHKLHYVRMFKDAEKGEFHSEGKMEREYQLAELPTEYLGFELGTEPVYIYHFYATIGGAVRNWYLTSYYENFVSDAVIYTALRIEHGSLQRTITANKEETTIQALYDSANPMFLYFPVSIPARLFCKIMEVTVPIPDIQSVLFTGEVESVNPDGSVLKAKLKGLFDTGRKIPRMDRQPRCPYDTYGAACGLNRADFEIDTTIDFIDERTVVVSGATLVGLASDYFSDGWLEVGTGDTFEIRTILKDVQTGADEHTLAINLSLNHASVSDTITLLPGDDKRLETCNGTKFNNGVNHGGTPYTPDRNLSLEGLEVLPDGGAGKK